MKLYKIKNMEVIVDTEHNNWIEITDDMINNVGYKSRGNKGNERTSLFCFIKKIYKKDTEYKFTKLKSTKIGRGGRNKLLLEMTQVAYDDLLIKTHNLRARKSTTEKHYIYVMHNPMFLHYGPNIFKIGYSKNIERRMHNYFTGYIDEPELVYRKEVASKDCETQLHRLMDAYRIKKTREFFDCPLQKIIEFIEML